MIPILTSRIEANPDDIDLKIKVLSFLEAENVLTTTSTFLLQRQFMS